MNVSKTTWVFIVLTILLCFVPFITDSRNVLILCTQVYLLAVFAMSYDLLLGFTGIISFGHAMFFGIGAYTTGIILKRMEQTVGTVVLSIIVGAIIAGIVSFFVGILTLRLKSHFYAMFTLALAGLFLVIAEKWRSLTAGNDGFTFLPPELFRDRINFYFIALAFMVVMYFLLRFFTQSPIGSILKGIRENEERVEALGYQVLHYKVIVSVVSGMIASMAGSLYGMTLRFVNTSFFATDMTLDALLITIIGGVGTLIGAVVGAGIIQFAHEFLTSLAPLHPIFERWIIFFGITYIIVVMFFPKGIVGSILAWHHRRLYRKKKGETAVKESEVV
ncbi:MAG: branched-chain amino acid ABC transporter permease [Bacillaceae bacterium]